jgi:hypothetical protein
MMENFGGCFCGGDGGRVCHGGGRCPGCWGLCRGELGLGNWVFSGGLGDGHGREVGLIKIS